MIRFFIYKVFILLTFCVSSYGYVSVTIIKYEGGISLYGKVAEASVILQENLESGTYKVEVITSSTGIVKALTSNRCDIFVSEGKIIGGVYLPSKFTKTTTKTDYLKRVTYTFNYEENKVLKETYLEELENKSYYDISKLKMVDEEKLVKSSKKKFLDMKKNDFISLYLNLSSGNLKVGDVSYVDQKDSDMVSLINQNSFKVSKNDAEDV